MNRPSLKSDATRDATSSGSFEGGAPETGSVATRRSDLSRFELSCAAAVMENARWFLSRARAAEPGKTPLAVKLQAAEDFLGRLQELLTTSAFDGGAP
jgi:hypothetical protein